MAIEVKELLIKMSIADKPKHADSAKVYGKVSEAEKREIINECVEAVIEKLDERYDR